VGRQRLESQANRQVNPIGIVVLDQRDLPRPSPRLQLLLARDGGVHVVVNLEVDQLSHPIFRSEARYGTGSTLVQPRHEVRSNTYIDRPVPPTGEDVDARPFLHLQSMPCSWMLNQVQHDDEDG